MKEEGTLQPAGLPVRGQSELLRSKNFTGTIVNETFCTGTNDSGRIALGKLTLGLFEMGLMTVGLVSTGTGRNDTGTIVTGTFDIHPSVLGVGEVAYLFPRGRVVRSAVVDIVDIGTHAIWYGGGESEHPPQSAHGTGG